MCEEELNQCFAGVTRRADDADFHKRKNLECRMKNAGRESKYILITEARERKPNSLSGCHCILRDLSRSVVKFLKTKKPPSKRRP
jgi:hypothetical protein